jgi:transposase-like protein
LRCSVGYDGFALKAKQVKLLVAYGITADGRRQLLSFQRAQSESYACGKSFLDNLSVRGLKGRTLQLMVLDGGPGLWSAIEEVSPLVAHQLCWIHKLRHVAKYGPKRYCKECVTQATTIMYAPSSAKVARAFRAWKNQGHSRVPKAVSCLEKDCDKLIPVFGFPQEIRKMIRTTNVMERCFREVRRRLQVMGYFQNAKVVTGLSMPSFIISTARGNIPRQKLKPSTS